jgi:fatty acid desaturase
MLRYRADSRTIGILAAYAALTAAAWAVDPHGAWLLATIAVLGSSAWLCAVVAHNTVHTPVFATRWMNQAFQVWVSLSYGFPISDYIPGHNLSHHRFTQQREDVMRTTKVRFRWNLLNLLCFFPAVTPGILRGNAEYRKLQGPRAQRWRRQLAIETAVVWSVKVGLLLIDWRKGLCLVLLPQLIANYGIVTINYLWHDGCDPDHPVNHSRNIVGPLLNFFALNNGFHGMHHIEPGLHWSLLPEAHARVLRPTLHPALEQRSMVGYLFRTFIYPGKRLRYDGTPLVLPEEAPDRSWVKASDLGEGASNGSDPTPPTAEPATNISKMLRGGVYGTRTRGLRRDRPAL